MSDTKTIIFLDTFKLGKIEYKKDDTLTLPFLEACLLTQAGAAKDSETGFFVLPNMHVSVFPDNCILDNLVNDKTTIEDMDEPRHIDFD